MQEINSNNISINFFILFVKCKTEKNFDKKAWY